MNSIAQKSYILAVDKGHSYTVRALVELGANVSTINLGGWTPLMMAAAKGDLETLATLLKGGASLALCFHPTLSILIQPLLCSSNWLY
jgi:uncharacterized protein